MINLYQTLLHKEPKDYEELISLVKKTRLENELKTCAIMRDRGRKADYVQTYYYNTINLLKIVNDNVEQGKWYVSIYLSWLLHETGVTFNNLILSFDAFCLFTENNLYRRIIETNRYECYGFCMSALTILDKDFLLNYNGDKKNALIKLALEGIVSYIYYHKGVNTLWDAEMYSNYARLFDRFKADMTSILMNNRLYSYAPYSYCYGMYEAFKCAPIECEYKLEYQKNALMMQQNQSVAGVTRDTMDACLQDAFTLGETQFMGFTTKMLQYSLVDELDLLGLRQYIEHLNREYNDQIEKQKGFENIRCLVRYFQIEPYESFGYIRPPYKRTSIGFDRLLENLGINENTYDKIELENGDCRVSTGIINFFPKYHKSYDYKEIEYSLIFYIIAIVRADGSMRTLNVVGNKLYELYRDISNTGLFFDIPCVVGAWEPKYIGNMQSIVLLVGTDNDIKHGFSDNII